jgi:membrane complex biogenesis BtpA family protein
MTREEFRALFQVDRPLIGMVHLRPLPGAPRYEGDLPAVIAQAEAEAVALAGAGFHGLVVENFNDAPFFPERVPAETVAGMTVAVREVTRAVRVPVGVNVLRNDGAAALAVAVATGAAFVRVNVLTGAMVTDQGVIQGQAHALLRLRRALGARTLLFADILVKHAQPLGALPVAQAAEEAVGRGLADGLIVSGAGTGRPTDLDEVRTARAAVPDTPILVGSGVTEKTVRACLEAADGVIVGSSLKRDGRAEAALEPERVAAFVRAVRAN